MLNHVTLQLQTLSEIVFGVGFWGLNTFELRLFGARNHVKSPCFIAHRIHVCYIYIYFFFYHQYTPNVSIYTSTMDPMGRENPWKTRAFARSKAPCCRLR